MLPSRFDCQIRRRSSLDKVAWWSDILRLLSPFGSGRAWTSDLGNITMSFVVVVACGCFRHRIGNM